MILWCDGGHGARLNMERDAALLDAVASGRRSEPVLRLFAFRPAGVTLGRAQDPERELDLDALAADGIEWAVRPTGGRAIFHDAEWTFSQALPLADGAGAAETAAAYARTGAWLAAALGALGVPATLAPGSPRGVGAPRGHGGPAAPCFASTARHELVLGGRKLAGIAQRHVRGALLQQGSLLLGPTHLRLADYLRLDPASRDAARSALAEAATDMNAHLPPDAALERLADALAATGAVSRRLDGEGGARALGLA